MADEYDIQIAIHTDTLNECGFLDDTIAAIKGGRSTASTPKVPAAAARPGHHQDRRSAQRLALQHQPTRPFTVNTIDEHLDMLMVCHHLSRDIPEDVAFAESRIRAETIGAEDVFHDRGIISMMSSDSQAMGRDRRGDRPHLADRPQDEGAAGPLAERQRRNDNERVKRYVAKYTINPAIAHGIAHTSGASKGASWPTSSSASRPISA